MKPNCITIDSRILTENFQILQRRFPRKTLAPIIKSNAYGHGLLTAARAFAAGGAQILSVFRVNEAVKIRQAGIQTPLWVLMGPMTSEAEEAVALSDTTLGVYAKWQAKVISQAAVKQNKIQPIHLAVDTGMSRLGVLVPDVPAMVEYLQTLPNLKLTGIYSHLAKGEQPEDPYTKKQVDSFLSLLPILPPGCQQNHLCASTGLIHNLAPELSFARPGFCLYAQTIFAGDSAPITQDAMYWKTHLISIKTIPAGHTASYGGLYRFSKDTLVGVMPVGYDDGLLRSISNRGFVLIKGHRAPIRGRVCMNMTMVELTDIPGITEETNPEEIEVVLLGHQGQEAITWDELASYADSTMHEPMCNIGRNQN